MRFLRSYAATLLSKGVISSGWYSILTAIALIYLAFVLGSAPSQDPAAPYVAAVFAVVGVYQGVRGVRWEVRRRQEGSRAS